MTGIKLIHGDSLEALKGYGDNYFDVAIVDPPYGMVKNTYGSGSKGIKSKFDCHIKNHR
jgi:DNA modification methylase